jgi:hypothetical protein
MLKAPDLIGDGGAITLRMRNGATHEQSREPQGIRQNLHV